MKKTAIAVMAGAVLVLAGCTAPQAEFTLFADAVKSCGNPDGLTVGDNGATLTIDMMGEQDWSGASIFDVECALDAISLPSYVKDNMYATNALAGRQSDTYITSLGGEGTDFSETDFSVDVSWSYHPDNGIDAVFHAVIVESD